MYKWSIILELCTADMQTKKNKLQSNLLLPGTDIFEAGAMQTSVNHDIDSVTSAIDNNPDVDIETIDPNDIETSTTN